MIDTAPIVDEVIEYFRQEIFPDEAAVIMHKLKYRYEPKLAHDATLDYAGVSPRELIYPAELNCIRAPYDTLGELHHSLFLIGRCWELIFALNGVPFHSGGETGFLYRDVLFRRMYRRRISYVPAEKWRYIFN